MIQRAGRAAPTFFGRCQRWVTSGATTGLPPPDINKPVCVFPGQGSQFPGMGKDLCSTYPVAKEIFQEADDSLGWSLSSMMFDTERYPELVMTAHAQPAILVYSLAMLEVFKQRNGIQIEGIGPNSFSLAIGHSLGEYTCLVATGAVSLCAGVQLVHCRGKAMQAAVPAGIDVAMAALMPTKYEDAVALCEIVRKELEERSLSNNVCCDVANYNAVNLVVVSGTREAVERVVQIGKELMHVRRATILEVSAPFHSTMMKQAREMFEPMLWETKFKLPTVPIVSNVDGHAYQQEVSTHMYKNLLLDQMSSTVQWVPMMELCRNGGFQKFIEFTPKKILGPLIKKHISYAQVDSLATEEDLDEYLKRIL